MISHCLYYKIYPMSSYIIIENYLSIQNFFSKYIFGSMRPLKECIICATQANLEYSTKTIFKPGEFT